MSLALIKVGSLKDKHKALQSQIDLEQDNYRQIDVESRNTRCCRPIRLPPPRCASCCATPRTANYILKRVRDYAQVYKKPIDKKLVNDVMNLLEIDHLGLTEQDRKLLSIIIDNFKGGPVGLNTLAASLSEEEETIEDVIEPYLLQQGLLERTSRGRVVTEKGVTHLRK